MTAGGIDESFPILEFDATPEAFIEPTKVIKRRDLPEHVVMCFFLEVIEAICGDGRADVIGNLKSEQGTHPIYGLDHRGTRIAVFHPGVGAPLAGGFMEEAIAMGGRKFVACGGAGALVRELVMGHVVIPTAAVRDEGTSYHYLAPARQVVADQDVVAAIESVLLARDVPYATGITWTTDGLYRETRDRIARRVAEGCVTVEMEAAAFMAIAEFRGVRFGQLLYAGDDVSGETWDHRSWQHSPGREPMFWLAVEACLTL